MSNAGLFSSVAREYANFRPGYPPEMFEWLAAQAPATRSAWDCGCGSGQASLALAAHFDQVHATDASSEQIAAAKPHARVKYSVAPAERSGLDAGSVDLVTAAQALHWFDVPAFYAEAQRVARGGALLAVWTYPRPELEDPALDRLFHAFYRDVVGPYWPPERLHVESHYQTLPFPFEELPHPPFGLVFEWSLEQLAGYASSWSATARCRQATGRDPLPLLRDALAPAWPADGNARVRIPIVLRAGVLRPGS
jgi:ubiquinone/menaquinone biosynthesis C-methylase UbiE